MKNFFVSYKNPLSVTLVIIILGGMFAYSKMQTSLAISETGKGDFRALLSNKQSRLLNRTLLAMFSTFSQQINGG